jgi:hypothetical protein
MPFTTNQVDITVTTGSDDLRGDSSVSLALFAPNRDQIASYMLKDRNDRGLWVPESRRMSCDLLILVQ